MNRRSQELSSRIYGALLNLYPAGFRREYGELMAQTFRDQCWGALSRGGRLGLALLWLHILRDLVSTALREHLSQITGVNVMFAKRLSDVVIAGTGLLIMAVMFPFVALAIKLDSSGPVFYISRRMGQNGRSFTLLKFRTMRVNAPLGTPVEARITRVGRFLRRTQLDEWPQFLNVWVGDMSVIGPRPELPERVDLSEPVWQRVLSVRPGMSGLAQMTYLHQPVDVAARQQMDLQYVERRSFLLDLRLLVRQFKLLLRSR